MYMKQILVEKFTNKIDDSYNGLFLNNPKTYVTNLLNSGTVVNTKSRINKRKNFLKRYENVYGRLPSSIKDITNDVKKDIRTNIEDTLFVNGDDVVIKIYANVGTTFDAIPIMGKHAPSTKRNNAYIALKIKASIEIHKGVCPRDAQLICNNPYLVKPLIPRRSSIRFSKNDLSKENDTSVFVYDIAIPLLDYPEVMKEVDCFLDMCKMFGYDDITKDDLKVFTHSEISNYEVKIEEKIKW